MASHVYKFLPPDRSDFFSNLTLRFTQPTELNDPFECLPQLKEIDVDEMLEGVIKRTSGKILSTAKSPVDAFSKFMMIEGGREIMSKQYKADPSLLRDIFFQKFKNNLATSFGILSLSTRSDSPVMWSSYCSEHKGFVVCFNPDHSFFQHQYNDNPDIGQLTDVIYSVDRPSVDINSVQIPINLLLHKDIDWRYENEKRLIRRLDCATKTIIKDSVPVCLFAVPPEAVTGVCFGMRCPSEKKQQIIKDISTRGDLSHVVMSDAKLDYNQFRVRMEPIIGVAVVKV